MIRPFSTDTRRGFGASKNNIRVIALTTLLCFLFLPAFAQSPADQVAQLEAELTKQEELSNAAAKDKQLARDYIEAAKEAQGSSKLFNRRIKRAEFAVDLVKALVAAAVIREQAEQQEAAAFSAPKSVEEMRSEVERLRKRKTELERELQKTRGN